MRRVTLVAEVSWRILAGRDLRPGGDHSASLLPCHREAAFEGVPRPILAVGSAVVRQVSRADALKKKMPCHNLAGAGF